ncbi:hypothetical protein CC86DRAFT_88486 [Ophiobolus disseminans]|uniref:Uncharacterized protein n=1 Tax=Ophiobolus disseminans TaxID=1469910 RepID=A0A6A7AIB1_9PLEO|nr:hypothetical protein CC86DRAFT_88486 [Ophiobolus disseminans]
MLSLFVLTCLRCCSRHDRLLLLLRHWSMHRLVHYTQVHPCFHVLGTAILTPDFRPSHLKSALCRTSTSQSDHFCPCWLCPHCTIAPYECVDFCLARLTGRTSASCSTCVEVM